MRFTDTHLVLIGTHDTEVLRQQHDLCALVSRLRDPMPHACNVLVHTGCAHHLNGCNGHRIIH